MVSGIARGGNVPGAVWSRGCVDMTTIELDPLVVREKLWDEVVGCVVFG